MSSLLNLKIENRSDLYYGKYKYRVRFNLLGLTRTNGAKTYLRFLKGIKELMSISSETSPWSSVPYREKTRNDISNIDLDAMERYYIWTIAAKENKVVRIRIEGNNCSIFSDDLELLKTVQMIDPTMELSFSSVDVTIPTGTKYFSNKPAHNYRVYFKNRLVDDSWRTELGAFIRRYKNTKTIIIPSKSLSYWISPIKHQWYNSRWCSSSYYIDFDDESTYTLLSLMYGDMLKSHFKLEQHPTSQFKPYADT